MATLNVHRLIMVKMKISIYCYFIIDILTKVFLEMSVEWSSTKHIFFVKTSQFNDCYGNQKAKYSKINSEAILLAINSETLQKCS